MGIINRQCKKRYSILVSALLSFIIRVRNVESFNTKSTTIKAFTGASKSKLWSVSNAQEQEQEEEQSYYNKKNYEEKAGIAGYSIQRQPLSWDVENDPYFKPPQDIDDDNNKIRMSSLLTDRYISQNKNRNNNDFKKNNDEINDEKSKESETKGVVSPKDAMVDLNSRTYDSLDYEIILSTLQKQCYTKPAYDYIQYEMNSFIPLTSKKKRKKNRLSAQTYNHVLKKYKGLEEMIYSCTSYSIQNKQPHPIRTFQQANLDISNIEIKIKNRNVLNSEEILDVLNIFTINQEWHDWFLNTKKEENEEMEFVEIPKLINTIQMNETFIDFLSSAFEKTSIKNQNTIQTFLKLSSTTFPKIGYLRNKIKNTKNDILEQLNVLLSNPTLRSKLALENGSSNTYAEMNGRIVIPLDIRYKNIGIVHDISRSGKTAYVEPSDLILPTNTLRQLESELETEENKVWKLITIEISAHWKDIQDIVHMLGQLDLLHSKYLLGNMLHGCIPIVKEEGVIDVKDAIHPILQLRHSSSGGDNNEKVLVKNDIQLGVGSNQGLILSGPNSGGKTIIMKTLGLLSYLVSCGIPVPVNKKDSRVDFFPTIIADIGDVQSVQGDLSTFSGHLVTYREMFNETKYRLQHNTLVIMDEVGSGTDPNQGVALAQSILESLVEKGCKVAITTHFQSLKQLPSYDDRFTIAGMQFINNNQPSYKLLINEIGESFALQIAQRYNLPNDLLNRAYELLDSDTKTRLEYLQTLENQKQDYEERLQEMQKKQEQIDNLQTQLQKQKDEFEQDYNTLQSKKLQEFIESLQDKENKLSNILSNMQKDSNKKAIAKSWEDIKILKKDLISETLEKEEQQTNYNTKDSITSYIPISDINPKPILNVGDVVYIYKPNSSFHDKPAKIHTIANNGKFMEVFIDGAPIPIRMKMSELMLPKNIDHLPKIKEFKKVNKKLSSKIGRRALYELENQSSSGATKNNSILQDSKITSSNVAMRTSSNTIDVRGKNLSEAQRSIEDFFSTSIFGRRYVVFILHGYGSGGVLRDKIRNWLNNKKKNAWVKKWKVADQSDGGDSFTCVELQSKLF